MASTFAEDRESWQSQPAENELNDEELDIYFGSGRTETVGVRYYSGIVSDKEMVTLVREPGNPYDTNAIRVNNTMGQQIGHIPRQVAAMMAPLLDSALLRVDAIIPFGSSNAFKIPLDVHLYGKREGAAAAHKVLRMLGSTSINFHPDTVFSPQQLAQAQAAQQRAAVAPSRYAAGGGMLLKEDAKNLQQFYTEPMPYDDMPAAAQPAALQSTLYLHQRKGLWWMMQREQALNVAQALDAKAAAAKGSTAPSRPTAAAAAASAVAGESAAVKAVRDGARAAISAASQYFFWERRNVGGRILYFNTLTGSQYAAPPALFRGGMLSDEMGLGKTLTTIALIVAQKAAHPARSGPTLIVAPKSVLGVWREEILRHTVEGTLRVHVYHNEADGTSIRADELAKFDVVLTTYTTVQMSTSLDRLEAAFKALEAAPAGTEAATAAAGKLSAARQMTTQSVLQRIRWHRVVLDEAHVIKEQKTKQSRACHLLDADIRWCLTGTPIQNKLMDMFTLVRFLRAAPFDDRTRWDALIVRPIRTQDVAGFRTLSALMAHVCLRRTKDQRVGPDAAPLITLPPAVTTVRRIPLAPADRERYDSIAALLQEQFEEMRKNSTLSGSYTTVMTVLIRLRQLACHSALVPAAMLQATIEAVRGLSVAAAPQSAMTLEQATALVKSVLAYAQDECPVCMELPSDEDAVVTPCAHMYCKMCIVKSIQENKASGKPTTCPLCRSAVSEATLYPLEVLRARGAAEADVASPPVPTAGLASSSKIEYLIASIKSLIAKRGIPAVPTRVEDVFTLGVSLTAAVLPAATIADTAACAPPAASAPPIEEAVPAPVPVVASSAQIMTPAVVAPASADVDTDMRQDAVPPAVVKKGRRKSASNALTPSLPSLAPAGGLLMRSRTSGRSTRAKKPRYGDDFVYDDDVDMAAEDEDEAPARAPQRSKSRARAGRKRASRDDDDEDYAPEQEEQEEARRAPIGRAAMTEEEDAEATMAAAPLVREPRPAPVINSVAPVSPPAPVGSVAAPLRPPAAAAGSSGSAAVSRYDLSGMSSKSVVFSQFTTLLDIISSRLEAEGIVHTRLDGSMSTGAREAAISAFQRDAGVHVILVSTNAGGTGITLTAATNVFVVDPLYNPQAQDQAVSRVHRLGQTAAVSINILVGADTLEEKMLVLQERKRALARGAFGGVKSREDIHKNRLDDIALLIGRAGSSR